MKKRIVVMMIALLTTVLFSQTTGVIRGVVLDEMGDPLPGANIVVVGTTWGAEADEDGYYYIIGVRAGTYTLRAQFIGFMPKEVQDVKVRVGLTTTQNFKMSTEVMELADFSVEVAMENKIEMDVTTSARTVDMDNLGAIAVTQVDDVLKQTAGVQTDAQGELHFRGGRSGEVNYQIDGVSVGDPTGAKTNPVEINFANVESFNIQKGIPDAEVGDALSGSVNIVMKIGDQEKTSGHVKYSTDAFMGDSKLDYNRGEFSLSGPIPLPMSGMKPTYYIGTDFTVQNGYTNSYRNDGDPDGEFFEFKDYDLTGFGFEIPQKRENNFNIVLKSAYDITMTMKLSASYTKSRNHDFEYDYRYRYTPQTSNETVEDVTIFNLNFSHAINANSYYDFVFSYYNREFERMPGGKTPDDFVFDTELDGFNSDHDVIWNSDSNGAMPLRDGGDAEGYIDANLNGSFDREYFIDLNGNGNYDSDEDYVDANLNGEWDGDYLYDYNRNNKWDYWQKNESYNGFESGSFITESGEAVVVEGSILTGEIVEGYEDKNLNGHYDRDNLYGGTGDEPYIDGDFFVNSGEPFIDFAIATQINGKRGPIVERANGQWNNDQSSDKIYVKTTRDDNAEVIYEADMDAFNELIEKHTRYYNLVSATSSTEKEDVIIDSVEVRVTHTWYRFTYGQEYFADLETSNTDSLVRPGINFTRNADNSYFDEFEQFCSYRGYGAENDPELTVLGWVPGHGPVDSPTDYYEFIGSYAVYRAPANIHGNIPSYTQTYYVDGYSTWDDLNKNDKFDYANSKFDKASDTWVDYNSNDAYDRDTGFFLPGIYSANATYSLMNNSVYKFKGSYTNQVSRLHMIKTGFELTLNDLDYYQNVAPYLEYDEALPFIEGDPYPDRGFEKTYYNYKPLEFSAFIQDKMEYEDLVVNAGVRLDMRRLDDAAADYYEEQYDAGENGYEDPLERTIFAVSPRLGISHSISEKSKLFFSYGHLYQKPNYTQVFQPNTSTSATPLFGNMNLGYMKNVQYELGVVNEIGNFLLDVTGYFKDIYDNVNTYTPEDQQGRTEATVYDNSDYGKSRGVEITLDRNLKDHYMWGLSYTLSYAYGKSSSETANFEEEVKAMKEYPLIWDERHALSTYFNIIYGNGEMIYGVPYTDNITLGLTTSFGSGKPFTPDTRYFLPEIVPEEEIETNSERMPWTSNTDLKLTKAFRFTNEGSKSYSTLKLEFNVFNLFNKLNVYAVYPDTGSWWRRSEAFYEANPTLVNYKELYADMSNVSEKRHYRFGLTYTW